MTLELSSPFPPESIHWRAQTVTKDGTKALALAYLDARDVMDRFDAVCTPHRWQDSYVETAKGRVISTISVLSPDGDWISKSDGAGNTAVEGEKGGISDAFKRAGVKWGVGRYLYDLGNIWAPCESRDNNGRKQWVKWKPEAEKIFADALRRLRPTGPINDTTRDWVGSQLQSVGKAPQDLLRHLAPDQLTDLTYEQLPAIQAFINSNKKAA